MTGQVPLSVRRMCLADLPSVSSIESRVQRFPWRPGQFRDAIGAGYQAWVLLPAQPDPADEGTPASILGYAILMPALDDIELLTLAVDARWQGQGVGRRWLDWLKGRARRTGMQSMLLEVAAGNEPALRLYAGAGFERIGKRRAYYRSSDGLQDDAWVMRCPLDVAPCLMEEAIHVID